jgi:2-methylisocitrate lyase-like PEP mutase family enzyme
MRPDLTKKDYRKNLKMISIRNLIGKDGFIIVPGVYDALSVKLAESKGFKAVYLTSFGVSLTLMCKPDIGLMTLTELVHTAQYICEATRIPVIADGEAGFGNAINVMRLINNLERLGVSGTDIQDQRIPRTHYLKGVKKELMPIEEQVKKIKAAVKARENRDFIIIGRTESSDLEDAIRRLEAYSSSGADMIFPHSKWQVDDLEQIAKSVKAPMVLNYPLIIFGKQNCSIFHLKNPWFKIVLFPTSSLFASIKAQLKVLDEIKLKGTDSGYDMVSFNYVDNLVNGRKFKEFESKYLP